METQRMEIDRRIRDVCRLAAAISFSFSVLFAQSPSSLEKVLTKVADVPMPGPAVRFDYQTFDPSSGRLCKAPRDLGKHSDDCFNVAPGCCR
jgi:hypothetical protein